MVRIRNWSFNECAQINFTHRHICLKKVFWKNGWVIKFWRAYRSSLFNAILLLFVVILYGDNDDPHDDMIRKHEMWKNFSTNKFWLRSVTLFGCTHFLLSPYVNFWHFFVTTVSCMGCFQGIIYIHIYSIHSIYTYPSGHRRL